ncbi:Junctional adhesion molecule B [Orchesella cincta]|uniref:Junctional adhesion molecule B n=1 Tax=Orchesella cincta TaxID=48709 RepID=A0A1D2N5V0_ORCCI|nr:Junctional adhesion molecule B [Orchesella cincta]
MSQSKIRRRGRRRRWEKSSFFPFSISALMRDWTLKIKYVQPRDAGIYECSVSTHPPSSIFVTLEFVEAQAKIVGGPEKFYKAGSSMELRCDLIDSTEEPEYVFWYQASLTLLFSLI